MENENYLQELLHMLNELEERREYITDNEYLIQMNSYMQSYLNFRNQRCTCTEDSFECYRYPKLFQNCINKDIILQQAPLLSILIPEHQIPPDFQLQLQIKYEPYDRNQLIKIIRFLFNVSNESSYIFDKIICAFSVFHLIFKHYGLLLESSKLYQVACNKLYEFETNLENRTIFESFDFGHIGISSNPIPIWRKNLCPSSR